MRIVPYLIFVGLSVFFIIACDEEINKPVFRTAEVTDLSPEGVTLNGSFQTSAGQRITDHGFVWATTNLRPTESDSIFHFYEKPSGKFQHRVTDGLVTGKTYFVRSFLIANSKIIYGNTIEFIAQGSATPEILKFEPSHGGSLDSVVITGDHFGVSIANTSVRIGELSCKVTSVTKNKIVFHIPLNYVAGSVPITLKIADKTVTTAEDFTLEGPIIQSISPSSGPAGTEIIFSGSGFSASPANNVIYFDDRKATVISATPNELKVVAPVINVAGEKKIALTYNHVTAYSPVPYHMTGPVITSFNPASGTTGTQITIKGSGFSPNPSENKVVISPFRYIYGTVLSASPNQLVVEVNPVYYSGNESELISNITVEVKSIVTASPTPFTVRGPTITGFSPTSQYEGRIMTIYGENFDPAGNNRVYFSNVSAQVINSTATSIEVKLPFRLPAESSIAISAGNYHRYFSEKYTVLSPWTKLADFPGGARYGVTTFVIGSYAYVAMGISGQSGDKDDVWRFDSSNNSWKKMSNFPGQSRAFAFSFVINGKAYVGGGGHYGSSLYNLISNLYDLWEYDPATDSWTQKRGISPNGLSGRRFQATGIEQYGYFGLGNILYKYDPALDRWSTSIAPIQFSEGGIAATIGNKGYFGLGIYNGRFWEFDPAANTWTQLADSPLVLPGGWGLLSSFITDGEIYACSSRMMVKFNPVLNEWMQVPGVPEEMGYKGTFGFSHAGYVATGINGGGFPSFYSFNPNY